jgi:hypothetical protein
MRRKPCYGYTFCSEVSLSQNKICKGIIDFMALEVGAIVEGEVSGITNFGASCSCLGKVAYPYLRGN